MAEKVLKQLEEQFNCSICLDTYTDPKLLQCFHVYCRQCLVPLVDRDQQGQLGLTCPICRQVTPIPGRGVAGLQSAFHINRFLEIKESLQRPENPAATLEEAAPTEVNPVKKASHCLVHEGKELELYCETCGELICLRCALKGGKHHDHSYEDLRQGLPDPSKCHVTGKVAEAAVVGEKCTAILQAINFGGELCKESIKSLECNYVSEITGIGASCSVDRSGQSQYKISYQPTIKGRHQLHVKVQGQHIRGSPFSAVVKSPVEKLGTPILSIGGVNEPWGVAINQMGEVVVAEWEGHHGVSVFSPSGKKLRSFGTPGSGPGQVLRPREVAVDGEGNILLADCENHRIQSFTPEGLFLTSVGTEGSGHLQFSCPTGIAFNATNNKVYVTDTDNHRIQVLNSELTFSSIFGKSGSGKGQFEDPWGIACDSTGKVYVADSYNDRIQVFTAGGEFLHMFGRRGQGRGELNYPVGVAIDTSGMVYVSEVCNDRVSVFTSEGQVLTSFGRPGVGPGEFDHPYGITVDNSGVVYVCDKHAVQLF